MIAADDDLFRAWTTEHVKYTADIDGDEVDEWFQDDLRVWQETAALLARQPDETDRDWVTRAMTSELSLYSRIVSDSRSRTTYAFDDDEMAANFHATVTWFCDGRFKYGQLGFNKGYDRGNPHDPARKRVWAKTADRFIHHHTRLNEFAQWGWPK